LNIWPNVPKFSSSGCNGDDESNAGVDRMTSSTKAATLQEVAGVTEVEPLPLGDPRYVDLSEGRDTRDLSRLRIRLKDFANSGTFAKFAFTGHRGCGKSTELLRMEHAVSDQFYPVHLFVDDGLLHSLEYTDLFLWIVDSVATKLTGDSIPVADSKIDKVREWFAEKIRVTDERTKAEVGIETEAKAKGGFLGLLTLMARLKSSFMGSVERRTEIRMSLKNFATDLVARLNDLFDAAREGLKTRANRGSCCWSSTIWTACRPTRGASCFWRRAICSRCRTST
jgi:hypothetical protein